MNRKKTQRLYGEEGLAVRRRRSRRRIAVARTPIPKPEGPNSRWSTDVPRRRPGHLAERQAGVSSIVKRNTGGG